MTGVKEKETAEKGSRGGSGCSGEYYRRVNSERGKHLQKRRKAERGLRGRPKSEGVR